MKNKIQSRLLVSSLFVNLFLIIIFTRFSLSYLNGEVGRPTELFDLIMNPGYILICGILLSVGILNFISVFRSIPSRKTLLLYGIQFLESVVISTGIIIAIIYHSLPHTLKLDVGLPTLFILIVPFAYTGYVFYEEVKWYKIKSISEEA
ncbi:hypothetical protein RJG79_07815 [Mycoplasmatota bacterium WC44]